MTLAPEPPVIISYAKQFYNALLEMSSKEVVEEQELVVFRGSFTDVFRRLGCSMRYYNPIRTALEECGSTVTYQRGGRLKESVLVLNGLPDAATLESSLRKALTGQSPSAKNRDSLEQRITNIERLIGGVNIPEALAHLQKQLNAQGHLPKEKQ